MNQKPIQDIPDLINRVLFLERAYQDMWLSSCERFAEQLNRMENDIAILKKLRGPSCTEIQEPIQSEHR